MQTVPTTTVPAIEADRAFQELQRNHRRLLRALRTGGTSLMVAGALGGAALVAAARLDHRPRWRSWAPVAIGTVPFTAAIPARRRTT